MPETQKKPQNPFASIAGIIGAVAGWGLSHYTGPSLWIPSAATILLLLLFIKTPFGPKYFRGAISVTGGHVIWFVIASMVAGIWSATLLDIVVLSLGLLWLLARPSLAPAIFLGVVQVVSLIINTVLLFSASVGSFAHKALTVHCVFRMLAITCLVAGYLRMQRAQSTPNSSATASSDESVSPSA